ncbi:hypothetical protein RNJ44_00155 [Nakaseomyces bracarensis]|uniref:Uncharacterized protein n=1 Tax=Nakaseomyces bracarensis TaxID=273131 RepID=A0ABR4NT18_9SACH
MEVAIKQAREALAENDSKKAISFLRPYEKELEGQNPNVQLLQAFADVYLEDGQLDKAYPHLVRSCEVDPQGLQTGSDPFFTLGQVVGGADGIQLISKGIENVSTAAGENLNGEQVVKIVNGLLSMIEIWMTDLCMEPEAESQCEELINKALEISDNQSAEALSTLGSIRISQQRFSEACEAFTKSWELFEKRKQAISNNNDSPDDYITGELAELLQPLLNLAKMCIEVGLYEVTLKVVGGIRDIDEDNLEGYYLEGFAHYMIAKIGTFQQKNPTMELKPETIFEFNQHIQEIELNLEDEMINEIIQEARIALTFTVKIGESSDASDEVVQELISGAKTVLAEIGGEVDPKILMKIKKGEALDDIDANLDDLESDEEIS